VLYISPPATALGAFKKEPLMTEKNYPLRFWIEPNEKSDLKAMILSEGHIIRLSVRAEMRIEGKLQNPAREENESKADPKYDPLIVTTSREMDSQSFELMNDEMIGIICRRAYNDTFDFLRKELEKRYGIKTPEFQNPPQ
jgi:hypothetical protein